MAALAATAPSAELERLKARLVAFERQFQYMRGRAAVARQYPTIWPQYQAAMNQAASLRQRVHTLTGLADEGYHTAQAMFGLATAQKGLAGLGWLWPTSIITSVIGLLIYQQRNLTAAERCNEDAERLRARNPGMTPDEASRIVCPERYAATWEESLPRIALYVAIGIGGLYLLSRAHTRPLKRRQSRDRRRR